MAECIRHFDFDSKKRELMEVWRGKGDIECRDLGSKKCIITLGSVEDKEKALQDPTLNSLFDELRPLWARTRCLSCRVWLEITGMPIQLWAEENFVRLASLWGKYEMMDDVTEKMTSFNSARGKNTKSMCVNLGEMLLQALPDSEVVSSERTPPAGNGSVRAPVSDVCRRERASEPRSRTEPSSPIGSIIQETPVDYEQHRVLQLWDPLTEILVNKQLDLGHNFMGNRITNSDVMMMEVNLNLNSKSTRRVGNVGRRGDSVDTTLGPNDLPHQLKGIVDSQDNEVQLEGGEDTPPMEIEKQIGPEVGLQEGLLLVYANRGDGP
ncbi:hypothetical protein PIB30_054373 [Stylosanthes scabra]|uniref:DUF4283 domain-containing protein n=1 Tax=Stylosanthes scabra TaxID=79078 RepID=A0ABU6RJE8_9FABA|nr:hypothetical protein [Stylosanthes scabra]